MILLESQTPGVSVEHAFEIGLAAFATGQEQLGVKPAQVSGQGSTHAPPTHILPEARQLVWIGAGLTAPGSTRVLPLH
jgi:hypothetical protein